jgi:hypothetical protein
MALLRTIALVLRFFFLEDFMPYQHTADIPEGFEDALVAMCRDALSDGERRCDPLDLLRCWNSESEVKAWEINPNGFAAGLFQAMPQTLHGLGWRLGDPRWATPDGMPSLAREFAQLTASEQLPWARAYYGAHRGSLTSAAHCYVATFLPAELPHAADPEHVLCALPGKHADFPHGKYDWAYKANHGAFDPEAKGWIQVSDMTARIERVAIGPRWQELEQRVRAAQCGPTRDLDLTTVAGVQCGLGRLGFDPGPLDGLFGPRTRAAVIAFAVDRELADRSGAITPEVQGALSGALATVA